MRSNKSLRKYVPSLLLFLLFEAVAVTLWLTKDNLFYLLNFSYIGGCLALGTALFTAGKRYARHFVQLAVRVHKGLPHKSTALDRIPRRFYRRGMLFLPALRYAQSIFNTGGVPNEPDSRRQLHRA